MVNPRRPLGPQRLLASLDRRDESMELMSNGEFIMPMWLENWEDTPEVLREEK